MFRPITNFLLRIENNARAFFEQVPFIQAFLAGVGVIIFWRGVWEWLDLMGVTPLISVLLGSLILGGVGVFLQTFIGNTIIIKNAKQEEKVEKKVLKAIEGEEETEEITLRQLSMKIDMLVRKIEERQ